MKIPPRSYYNDAKPRRGSPPLAGTPPSLSLEPSSYIISKLPLRIGAGVSIDPPRRRRLARCDRRDAAPATEGYERRLWLRRLYYRASRERPDVGSLPGLAFFPVSFFFCPTPGCAPSSRRQVRRLFFTSSNNPLCFYTLFITCVSRTCALGKQSFGSADFFSRTFGSHALILGFGRVSKASFGGLFASSARRGVADLKRPMLDGDYLRFIFACFNFIWTNPKRSEKEVTKTLTA